MTTYTGNDTDEIINIPPPEGEEDDRFDGRGGNDYLVGNGGNDILLGGDGADTLHGDGFSDSDRDSDAMFGEAGDDFILLNGPVPGGAGISDLDHVDGGSGIDVIAIGAFRVDAARGTRLVAQGDDLLFFQGDWLATIIRDVEAFYLTGSDGIDDFFGGALRDSLAGRGGADRLDGRGGDDALYGDLGDDLLTGGADDDYLSADTGDDTLDAGEGDDLLLPGEGRGLVDGGLGTDTVRYFDVRQAMVIDLAAGTAVKGDIAPTQDRLVSIENIGGAGFSDQISGDAGANTLNGLGGEDALFGREGDDTLLGDRGTDVLNGGVGDDLLDGGRNSDAASYAGATGGVTVRLDISGPQETGTAGRDTLVSIERLTGSAFNDRLTGNALDNVLNGGAGDDALIVGAGGLDGLNGGAGSRDFASFINFTVGVTYDLAVTEPYQRVGGGWLRTVGIEGLRGSAHADILSGDAKANDLIGAQGDDRLSGAAGTDRLNGGLGADDLRGGAGSDRFAYAAIGDSTVAMAGQDVIADFSVGEGDRIELSGIDANGAQAGNTAFAFIGSAAFGGTAGQLRTQAAGADLIVLGDVDGDRVADFAVRVLGVASLGAESFML